MVVQRFIGMCLYILNIGVLVGRWEGCHLVSEKITNSFHFNLFSFSFLFTSYLISNYHRSASSILSFIVHVTYSCRYIGYGRAGDDEFKKKMFSTL